MNWGKVIINVLLGSSLVILFCCGGSKQLSVVENSEVMEEVNYLPYYLGAYQGNAAYHSKNYIKSFEIYDSIARKNLPPFEDDMLKYLQSAYLSKQSISVSFDTCIYRLIRQWGYNRKMIETDSALYHVFLKSSYTWNDYYNQREKYLGGLNLELRDSLANLYIDNKYLVNDISRKFEYWEQYQASDTIEKRKLLEMVKRKTDSIRPINTEILIRIFSKYGYPDESIVGNINVDERDNYKYFFNVLISDSHLIDYDTIYKTFFIPKGYEFLKQGKITPMVYARMVDNWNRNNYNTQIYGTYMSYPTIEDSVNLDKNRKSIGLPKERKHMIYRSEDDTTKLYVY